MSKWMNESSEIGTFKTFISPSFSISLAGLQSINNTGKEQKKKITARLQLVKCVHVCYL